MRERGDVFVLQGFFQRAIGWRVRIGGRIEGFGIYR